MPCPPCLGWLPPTARWLPLGPAPLAAPTALPRLAATPATYGRLHRHGHGRPTRRARGAPTYGRLQPTRARPTDTTAAGTTLVVDGTGDAKVVAPGTTGSMTFTVTGTAEVRAKMTVSLAGSTTVELKQGGSVVYEPIKWTLTKDDGISTTVVAENKNLADITTAVSGVKEYIAPNTTLGTTYTLSWSWPFDGVNDTYDTHLGNIANSESVDGFTATTSMTFKFAMTIEQTQEA